MATIYIGYIYRLYLYMASGVVSAGEILCIHGGIGDSINLLDDLRGIPKPIQAGWVLDAGI